MRPLQISACTYKPFVWTNRILFCEKPSADQNLLTYDVRHATSNSRSSSETRFRPLLPNQHVVARPESIPAGCRCPHLVSRVPLLVLHPTLDQPSAAPGGHSFCQRKCRCQLAASRGVSARAASAAQSAFLPQHSPRPRGPLQRDPRSAGGLPGVRHRLRSAELSAATNTFELQLRNKPAEERHRDWSVGRRAGWHCHQ